MIEDARLYAKGELPVRCGECGWDNGGRLVLVDRYATDYPPIPRGDGDFFIEAYLQSGGDPDDRIHECENCSVYLDRISCTERT